MQAPERDPRLDRPRRIAFVITHSHAIGGAQLYVLELAAALQAAGHVIEVFVGGEGIYIARLREAGLSVTPIPAMDRAIDPRAEVRATAQLWAALRRFGPELISTHTSKAGILGRVLGPLLRVPVVVTAHGWLLTPGRLTASQQLIRAVETAAGLLADRVLAVSEHDRRIALEHRIVPDAKIRVVHNALHDVAPNLLADPGRAPPRVVMVARFTVPKDPVRVVEALAQLRELDWRCSLIGDGPLRPQVEAAVRAHGLGDRVELLGARDDVAERLAEAQIALLISQREGLPLAVLEGMRAGLPIVASEVGGIPEAVTPDCGVLVGPGPAALAAGLAPLIRDPALRIRLGAAARRRFVTEFDYAVHVRRTWAVYAELLEPDQRSKLRLRIQSPRTSASRALRSSGRATMTRSSGRST